jgi:hypothetical protein
MRRGWEVRIEVREMEERSGSSPQEREEFERVVGSEMRAEPVVVG